MARTGRSKLGASRSLGARSGAEFFSAVKTELGSLPFIVEDLGLITPDVCALRDQFSLPGTRVLQFAFDGHSDNPHLPHNYTPNTVVYTGTHDNPPTREWYEELPDYQRQNVSTYLKSPPIENRDVAASLISLAWSSMAALAIAPICNPANLADSWRRMRWSSSCTRKRLNPSRSEAGEHFPGPKQRR